MELNLSAKQQQRVDDLILMFLKYHSYGKASDYEIKEWKIQPLHDEDEEAQKRYKMFSISISVGRVGDEGTYGELIGRDRKHFIMGKNGRLSWYRQKRRGKGTKHCTSSFWNEICATSR